jgi:hypothetical protein
MASRFVRKAVEELASYIRTNLPTYLRATETAEGLAASSLEDPVEVLEANAPHLNTSPMVQVWAERWEFTDHSEMLLAVDCTVAINITGSEGLAALTARVDRYVTALLLCLTASRSLDNAVVQALPTDGERATVRGDDSVIRQVFAQGVAILLDERT